MIIICASHKPSPPCLPAHLQKGDLRQVSAAAAAAAPATCWLRERLIAELEEYALVGLLAAAPLAPAIVHLGRVAGRAGRRVSKGVEGTRG